VVLVGVAVCTLLLAALVSQDKVLKVVLAQQLTISKVVVVVVVLAYKVQQPHRLVSERLVVTVCHQTLQVQP
jgi:hypothetical protein